MEGFWSACGALPDLGSNTNPLGYKLSWAPASLIGASKRSARIMVGGSQVGYPDGETYQHPSLVEIDDLGCFEVYANADSLPYIEGYGISGVKDIYRGTLRYPGWCELISAMQQLRLFEEDVRDFSGRTHASLIREAIGVTGAQGPLGEQVAQYLGLPVYSAVVEKLEWLCLFDETPVAPEKGSIMDVVSRRYAEKLQFSPGERDLVVMRHRYDVFFPETGKRKRITATMVQTGSVDADTAIHRADDGNPDGRCGASGSVRHGDGKRGSDPDDEGDLQTRPRGAGRRGHALPGDGRGASGLAGLKRRQSNSTTGGPLIGGLLSYHRKAPTISYCFFALHTLSYNRITNLCDTQEGFVDES